MKKLIGFILTLMVAGLFNGLAQGFNTNRGATGFYQNIHQEGIYIHNNNNILFAGEKLYYKIYVINLKDQDLSILSKMAYVRLIDGEGNSIFSHKIRLENGVGYSDFSIPTEIATGSYKLVAYTQWMQSRKTQAFFESDLIIINPYKVTPEKHLAEVEKDSLSTDSLLVQTAAKITPVEPKVSHGEHLVNIELGQTSFGQREKIDVQVRALQTTALGGNYSISVKRLDPKLPAVSSSGVDFWRDKNTLSASSAGYDILPELRGELFSGRVVDAQNQQGVPGQQVVLSIPGDAYLLEIAQTDQTGRFYFILDTQITDNEAVFQLLDPESDSYEIKLDPEASPEFNGLEFTSFTIDPAMEPSILKRSVHNQIENAYGVVKSDTVLALSDQLPFYRDFQQQFILDDFTRFNTLRETMVEIVDHAWIDENGNEPPTFGVRPLEGYLESTGLLPAVVVDGLYIRDHKDFTDYNSKLVRSIALLRDRIMLGPQQFQGVLSIQTNTGEFAESFFRGHLNQVQLKRPEPYKGYFFQQHSEADDNERIPDFRYQLYWQPNFELSEQQKSFTFYTSDIKGSFEIELQGYDQAGYPVSISREFSVE